VSGFSRTGFSRTGKSASRACEKIRRLNAELAEHAEKSPKHFFSAASAASALNVICSQTLTDSYCFEAEADEVVPPFTAGYSLEKPVRSLVMVKLPSVRADSLM